MLIEIIERLKIIDLFLAANLNSSELYVKQPDGNPTGTQFLYHLVIALDEDGHEIDISTDTQVSLENYLRSLVSSIEAGIDLNTLYPVDIRRGQLSARTQTL